MDDQYGLPDLRQLIATRTTQFSSLLHLEPPLPPPPPPRTAIHTSFSPSSPPSSSHYEPTVNMLSTALANANANSTHPFATATPPPSALTGGFDIFECGSYRSDMIGGAGTSSIGSSRWPRQETLTLLEIRSRLDPKFKEANQKGPLWDEVSRIMSEEHGYNRSGKKCREKFENLYKYYKKTKEGKAGRQDGKNYRFFRQLEAIYGESTTANRKPSSDNSSLVSNINFYPSPNNISSHAIQDQALQREMSLSFSNSSSHELETASSSENNEEDLSAIAFMMNSSHSSEKKKRLVSESDSSKRSKKGWKEKVKHFVDSQMRDIIEKQEAWMENMLKTIELKEQERVCREMEWKREETVRFDCERELWAKQRVWIEARDTALMEALRKFTGHELTIQLPPKDRNITKEEEQSTNSFSEPEMLTLIQLITSLEPGFQECGFLREGFWEVISAKMACLGFNRSAGECQEKWENVRNSFRKITEWNKKPREDFSRSQNLFFHQLHNS
ncbi:hypothetical protein NL676_004147 [Syzygium grande]|nr:hypothetical protein NL676_004147 [Syzygium grande]